MRNNRKWKKIQKFPLFCKWFGYMKIILYLCIETELPKWYVHSANPVAKENIEKLLDNYEYRKDMLDNKGE